VNPQFTRLTGYSLTEVKGQNPRLLKSGETPNETYEALWQTITSGGQWHGEFHNRAKDGTLFWESVKISPIVNTQGETTHYLAIKEDISARMKREQEQNALLTLAMALRAANSRDEIVASILEQGARMVGAPIAAFISCNEGDDELTFEAAYRDGDPIYEALLPLPKGAGISAMTLKSGKPYRCDNVFEDEGFLMTDLIGDERAAVCLPLIANGETLGVLWAMRSTRFTSDEVRVLSAAADMGAISLQRARLHDKVMRYTINLENEVASRTKELAEANERLKELDRLKSKFVSDVTHELRTPVTNIGLYLTLLEHKPQKLAEYIPILTGQAERLRTLVKDTLDLSRMDHNRERLNIAAVDLNELVTNIVAAHSVRAEELQLALEFISDSTLPLIKGDSDRLTQVVTNLVANALNYTPNGQVRITTSFDAAECMVRCSVEDTGCGIHMDDIPHLFDRFYRGRRDEMAPVPGTGLGLSIVKEIVDMHGGKIDVTSEIGFGSTFTVSLPLSQKPSVPGRESAGREKA
jgi:PAS domain S-box-containing protein